MRKVEEEEETNPEATNLTSLINNHWQRHWIRLDWIVNNVYKCKPTSIHHRYHYSRFTLSK